VATKPLSDAGAQRLGELLHRVGARRPDIRNAVAIARRYVRAPGSGNGSQDGAGIALIARVADLLAQRALDHSWKRSDVGKIADTVARITGLPIELVRLEIQARVTRDPRIIALSPPVAIETELKVFYALTDVREVSLWTTTEAGGMTCAFSAGSGKPGRSAKVVARAVLEQEGREQRSGGLQGVAVLRWQRPEAALVFSPREEGAGLSVAAARETGAALTLVLEREALLLRSAARERALVEGGERLLARLGFDLHDGPIQDIAALAGDVRLLRGQLGVALTAAGGSPVLLGRIDDLEARIFAADRALRDIVHSLESPSVSRRPLGDVLRREIDAFAAQAEIETDLVVRGEFSELTDSQRIALVRIIQESLTNIREHSGATKVSVSVTRTRDEIAAEVSDNGRGFDVERTLVRTARNGRVGLLGMSERARLLGGRFDVRSRRGGPTTISAILPAWRPATAASVATQAEVLRIG
jgi:signal transduction histidine kinase